MKNWADTRIAPSATLREAIKTIDDSSMQIALVTGDADHLLGTVTDGDIRRGILRGLGLDAPVTDVMNTNPATIGEGQDRTGLLDDMRRRHIHRIPVVTPDNRVVGLELLEDLLVAQSQDNWVVLMAGGLGSRLAPLTKDCPKPMLKVGNKPLLETILETFVEHGFRRFFISVNYMAEVVKDYFGDGAAWGVEIAYLEEDRKLGTAGALSLLPGRPAAPIFVMNGDILTKVNFRQLLDFHRTHQAKATMCVRDYEYQVPYGVVRMDHHRITGIEEKPTQRYFVNAGIYVIEPAALDHIPAGSYYDMPSLFETLIREGSEAAVFPLREYWLDIGHMADFDRANGEFARVFA